MGIEKRADPSLTVLRRRAVLICVATTIVVAVFELLVGWRFALLSVMTEGLHTAADLLDSLIALALVIAASRPADSEHPYGHGKYDSLVAVIEGGGIGAAAAWALFKASQVLLGLADAAPRPDLSAMAVMLGASVVYLVVSGYVLRLASRTHSPAVYAEAMHLRTHVYITIGLLVGLLLSRVGLDRGWAHAERLDSLAALILACYLLTVAVRVIRPGLRQLVDAALPRSELDEIVGCLDAFRGEFVEIHAVRTRRAGTDRHVDIHLVVAPETTVQAAHDLSHRIEDRLVELYPGTRLLVHVEPAVGDALRDYVERDRVGVILLGKGSPVEREATHHTSDSAHDV